MNRVPGATFLPLTISAAIGEVAQPAVGARADERLVDLLPGHLGHRSEFQATLPGRTTCGSSDDRSTVMTWSYSASSSG